MGGICDSGQASRPLCVSVFVCKTGILGVVTAQARVRLDGESAVRTVTEGPATVMAYRHQWPGQQAGLAEEDPGTPFTLQSGQKPGERFSGERPHPEGSLSPQSKVGAPQGWA